MQPDALSDLDRSTAVVGMLPPRAEPPGSYGWYGSAKRAADVVLAACGLILCAPLMLIVAALIYLDDPGPVIFRQTRVGRLGRQFVLLKFRTMKLNTPNVSTEEMQRMGASFTTRIGGFLRKTSIDELPQLWNVVRGEMSLIGPRPALPSQEDVNTLRLRAGVDVLRPGITGLAQVRGRDSLDTAAKVGYDSDYLRTIGLATDLRIAVETATAVITSKGNR